MLPQVPPFVKAVSRRYWAVFAVLTVFFLRILTDVFPPPRPPGGPPPPPQEKPYFFEVVAAAAQPPVRMQLYFLCQASAYSEQDSILMDVDSAEPKAYLFSLPPGAGGCRGLRLKPLNAPGSLRILSSRIVDGALRETHLDLPPAAWPSAAQAQPAGIRVVEGGTLEVTVQEQSVRPVFQLTPQDKLIAPPAAMTSIALINIDAIRFWLIAIAAAAFSGTLTILLGARLLSWLAPRYQDAPAVTYLLALVLGFLLASACNLNGTSAEVLVTTGLTKGPTPSLLGQGRSIRSDEWNSHTPSILYQLNRRTPLEAESISGPGLSILLNNAPAKHWTMLFRPQLWGFFVLPPEYGFAVYWQWKHLLLLSGTFLLFRLLTASTNLAIFGSLWFHLSAYTQWAFSWPAMLPEMIGLACLSVVLAAAMLTATRTRTALISGALFVWVTVNFTLCAYPPFQIPIVYAACGLFAAWLLRESRPDLKQGFIRFAMALAGVGCVLAIYFFDMREVVAIVAQTVYPGRRSLAGGGITWQLLTSGFLNSFVSEGSYPKVYGNICEVSTYFWFGPVALAFAMLRRRSAVYFGLLVPFLLLLAWMMLPIPASWGSILLLDKVIPHRALPALGLLNVAMTLVFLKETERRTTAIAIAAASGAIAFGLFYAANISFEGFYSAPVLLATAAVTGAAIAALAAGAKRRFAVLVLIPIIWSNLLVNPVHRGLDMFYGSDLQRFANGLRDGRWLVFSPKYSTPAYLGALGLDVFNFFNIAPYLDAWRKFDPDRKLDGFYNGSGMAVVEALPPGSGARMEHLPGVSVLPPLLRRFMVDPADPRLREWNIRYFAYEGEPRPELFPPDRFERLTAKPLNGIVIFRAR